MVTIVPTSQNPWYSTYIIKSLKYSKEYILFNKSNSNIIDIFDFSSIEDSFVASLYVGKNFTYHNIYTNWVWQSFMQNKYDFILQNHM